MLTPTELFAQIDAAYGPVAGSEDHTDEQVRDVAREIARRVGPPGALQGPPNTLVWWVDTTEGAYRVALTGDRQIFVTTSPVDPVESDWEYRAGTWSSNPYDLRYQWRAGLRAGGEMSRHYMIPGVVRWRDVRLLAETVVSVPAALAMTPPEWIDTPVQLELISPERRFVFRADGTGLGVEEWHYLDDTQPERTTWLPLELLRDARRGRLQDALVAGWEQAGGLVVVDFPARPFVAAPQLAGALEPGGDLDPEGDEYPDYEADAEADGLDRPPALALPEVAALPRPEPWSGRRAPREVRDPWLSPQRVGELVAEVVAGWPWTKDDYAAWVERNGGEHVHRPDDPGRWYSRFTTSGLTLHPAWTPPDIGSAWPYVAPCVDELSARFGQPWEAWAGRWFSRTWRVGGPAEPLYVRLTHDDRDMSVVVMDEGTCRMLHT